MGRTRNKKLSPWVGVIKMGLKSLPIFSSTWSHLLAFKASSIYRLLKPTFKGSPSISAGRLSFTFPKLDSQDSSILSGSKEHFTGLITLELWMMMEARLMESTNGKDNVPLSESQGNGFVLFLSKVFVEQHQQFA